MTKFRTAYAKPLRSKQHVGETTRTQQHMAQQCNVNNIMKKYGERQILAHYSQYQGNYDDFTVLPSFHEAMQKMKDAEAMFMTIPAEIRELFQNDPGKFVEFATDPENLDEMRELGLAPAAPVVEQPQQQAKPQEQSPDTGDKKPEQSPS